MASGLKTMSGRTFIMAWGVPVDLPIEATLDPQVYEGAMVYGRDGILYYSDGVEWQPPVETPIIQRPYALAPTTALEQRQLRLSPFVSTDPAVTQTGITFEVASDNDFNNILFTENVNSTTATLLELTSDYGIDAFQRIYWRARYRGTGGNESRFSVPFSQVYPPAINTPEPVTPDSSFAPTLEITAYDSAFGYQYYETQWEIYDNAEGTGTPLYFEVSVNGATLPTPDVSEAGAFWFRARYLGINITTGDFEQSEWSILRRYVQPPLASLFTVDTTLSAGTTFAVQTYISNVVIDWGDGTSDTASGTVVTSHTYAVEGTYEVKITGATQFIKMNSGREKVTRCDAIGFNHGLTRMDDMFSGCTNLVFVPSQIPPGMTNMNTALQNCSSLNAPIALWDVSKVTDFANMFRGAIIFNQDIGSWDVGSGTTFADMFTNATAFDNGGSDSINDWDVSSATRLTSMFEQADSFNRNIGDWNTSNVLYMDNMFFGANSFNRNIGNWNVGNVLNMSGMFSGAVSFNNGGSPAIANWNTANVTTMNHMFRNNPVFNQPIGSWDVSSVLGMIDMFRDGRDFNQNVGSWDVSACAANNGLTRIFYNQDNFNNGGSPSINNWVVTGQQDFATMFFGCREFNQPVGNWDMSSAVSISGMFRGALRFNQDIGAWDVSNVTNMSAAFRDADDFNNGGSPSINNWNTINVTNMDSIFYGTSFNQPIGSWNTSNVTNMSGMFAYDIVFNQDIGGWDVSNVTSFLSMFAFNTAFNQDIGGWNTGSATNMSAMFRQTFGNFQQDLGSWDIADVTTFTLFLNLSDIGTTNYNSLLVGWEAQAVQNGVTFDAGNSKYSAGAPAAARAALIADHLWTITDGGQA